MHFRGGSGGTSQSPLDTLAADWEAPPSLLFELDLLSGRVEVGPQSRPDQKEGRQVK